MLGVSVQMYYILYIIYSLLCAIVINPIYIYIYIYILLFVFNVMHYQFVTLLIAMMVP